MVFTKVWTLGLTLSLCGLLAACGERPQEITYKQGEYQGKRDTQPWDNVPYSGDKLAWERALKDRAQAQNEYKRVP